MTAVMSVPFVPPVDPKDSLPAYLEHVLDTVVGVFEQADVPLPERKYWQVGGVIADCAQLTVHLSQVYKGLPGEDPNMAQRCGSFRTAVMSVQLFREIPVGNGKQPPTPESLMEKAVPPAVDAWLLLDAAEAVDAAGLETGVISELNVIEPSGGLVGWNMTLSAPIP